MNTKQIGEFGERAAGKHLADKGYRIIRYNFRMKMGEVDIIAKKDSCIVFVEVKTRKNNLFGEPSEYVNRNKQMRIRKAAACYTDIINNDVRFDVIEVFYEQRGAEMAVKKINHIENAF